MEQITIQDRKKITIQGATKMLSSTATQAVVELDGTSLVISGSGIEVVKLDLDNKMVEFSGNINAVKYMQKTEKTPLLKRIFK